MIDKKGENDFEFIYAYIEFMHFMFLQNGENDFESLYKKGEKVFGKRIFNLCMFLSPSLCIYICLLLCTSLNIYLIIVMHELRGSFYETYL